jgi:hypothetical protein
MKSNSFYTPDKSREDSHHFIQPSNIETVQGSQHFRLSVFIQKANHLHSMDHNKIGDFLQTEPTLSSQPRNITEEAPV